MLNNPYVTKSMDFPLIRAIVTFAKGNFHYPESIEYTVGISAASGVMLAKTVPYELHKGNLGHSILKSVCWSKGRMVRDVRGRLGESELEYNQF